MGELNTVQTVPDVFFAEKNDESGTGADEQCIGKHSQCLDESLFGRMGDMGGSCRIRGRTHTGFVAKQPAFDTLHQGGSDSSSDGLVPSESAADNLFDDSRNPVDVAEYDKQCQQDVAYSHDGNNDAADGGYPLHASEDDNQCKYRDDGS